LIPAGAFAHEAALARDLLPLSEIARTLYKKERRTMLRLALLFFVIALIAAFMGFPLTGAVMWEAGRIFFFVFIVLAVLALLGGAFYGRRPPL
jgi:uncharacterized membrane protein YtjA (UPF0391 family)